MFTSFRRAFSPFVLFYFVSVWSFFGIIIVNVSLASSVLPSPTGKLRAFPRHEAAAGGGRTEPGKRGDAPGHVRAQHAHAAQGDAFRVMDGLLFFPPFLSVVTDLPPAAPAQPNGSCAWLLHEYDRVL